MSFHSIVPTSRLMLNRGVGAVGYPLLGSNGKQRLRTSRTLHASAVRAVLVSVLLYGMALATVPLAAGQSLVAILSVSMIAVYAMFRIGLNLRAREPSLALPQIVFALSCTAGASAMSDPLHSAPLMRVVAAVAVGAFSMPVRRINAICALTLAGFVLIAFREMSQFLLPCRQIADSSRFENRPKPYHVGAACDASVKAVAVKSCRVAMLTALAAAVLFGRTRGGMAACHLKRSNWIGVVLAGGRRQQSWIAAMSQLNFDPFKRPQGS